MDLYGLGFDKQLYRIGQVETIENEVQPTQLIAGSLDLGKIQFLPNETDGLVIRDDDLAEIFKVIAGGTDVGDVIMGASAGQHAKWDKSAGTFAITGGITATTGAIGGWSINATSIYTGTEDHSGYTANAGDLTIYSDGTNASIHGKLFYFDAAGVLTCSGATIGGSTISTPTITGIATGSEIAIQGWTHDLVFSVTDLNTVAWSSGTITLMNGDTYSIDAGNTGNMAAETFVYLAIATSVTVLQTTTTKATAVGTGKIMVAICENATDEAEFVVFGSSEANIDGLKIRANSITANEIGANVITAAEIFAGTITATQITGSTLSAIYADLGTITAGNITLDASGYIKGGQTDYETGTGFFLGYKTDAYKFSIGNPAGYYFTFDGTDINMVVKSITTGDKTITVTTSDNIQTAIDNINSAGGGTVYLQPGTYTLTDDLILYSDITLKGTAASECIIDFDDNLKYIKIIGEVAPYTTGTVSITQATKIVTGDGTSWSANVAVGDFIKLGNVLYEILTVDSNTQLTLVNRYGGENNADNSLDLSGATYNVATYKKNIVIENLWITNGGIEEGVSGEGAIHLSYVKDSIIRNCIIDNARSRGIKNIPICYNLIIEKNQLSDNDDLGIEADDLLHSTIAYNICNNNSVEGIFLANGSNYNLIIGNHCSHNNSGGILIYGSNNSITNNQCNKNQSRGIDIGTSSGNENVISNNICIDNSTYGIYIDSSPDRNIILGNQLKGNTSGAISNNGTNTEIGHNIES